MKRRGGPLSNPFKVASEIYRLTEEEKQKVWYGKLVERLSDVMSTSTLMTSINELVNWGIVKVQFGQTDKGRAGRLLYISGESRDVIKSVYETYWKDATTEEC